MSSQTSSRPSIHVLATLQDNRKIVIKQRHQFIYILFFFTGALKSICYLYVCNHLVFYVLNLIAVPVANYIKWIIGIVFQIGLHHLSFFINILHNAIYVFPCKEIWFSKDGLKQCNVCALHSAGVTSLQNQLHMDLLTRRGCNTIVYGRPITFSCVCICVCM